VTAERIDTVVIGGGQAGLTMSHCLTRAGREHVVLERHRIAERWRSERWDSLRFQFPNWAMQLPGFGYVGDEPDAYAPRDEVVRFIEAYARFIRAPVRTCVEVQSLRSAPDGFCIESAGGSITATNVVIATGPYQRPAIPTAADRLGDVAQLPASAYRNPDALPPGGVLVVGAGASGCQIAEELLQAGRQVVLSVGAHRRVPRRYRGRDFIWWINALGLDDKVIEQCAVGQPPLLISGANGGHTVDLRRFGAQGMVLAGRFADAQDGIASFAPDLAANLAGGDESYAAFLRSADAFAAQSDLPLPTDPDPTYSQPVGIETLDLRTAGIASVIWATGYHYDFDWIDLPVFAADGRPIHQRGVTDVPGAYFLGLQYLHKTKSSFLSGVGEDAAYLAKQIDARAH
jgi:putative flavoprotein involved in K+ transport